MTQTTTSPSTTGPRPAPARRSVPKARTAALVGVAAATVLLVAVTSGPSGPGGTGGGSPGSSDGPGSAGVQTLSGTPVLLAAAEQAGNAQEFRAVVRTTEADGTTTTATGEFDGADFRITGVDPEAPGDVLTLVGSVEYLTTDGRTSPGEPVEAGDTLVPLAASTEHVLRAALSDGAAVEVGVEQVRGVEATHYRLALTPASRAALRALPAGELAWFELEDPDATSAVDVWVADELIRRIDVTVAGSRSRTEFYDFGADIRIEAPVTS